MSQTLFTKVVYGFQFDMVLEYDKVEAIKEDLKKVDLVLEDVIYNNGYDSSNEYIIGKELVYLSDHGFKNFDFNLTPEDKNDLENQIILEAQKIGVNTKKKKCGLVINLIHV